MFGKILGSALKGINTFFSKERIVVIAVFLLLIWLLYNYASSKSMSLDGMGDGSPADEEESAPADESKEVEGAPNQNSTAGSGYATHEVADPKDLLPADENSQWASLNPTPNTDDVAMPNLLKAGQHLGTVSQVCRNANLQVRSDPVIPKKDVGPWNQTTIEDCGNRRPLEIGPSA